MAMPPYSPRITELEMAALDYHAADVQRQVAVLTGQYHGEHLTQDEVEQLKKIFQDAGMVCAATRLLLTTWRARVFNGQEPNRSDTGGADEARAARPSDDLPPSATR